MGGWRYNSIILDLGTRRCEWLVPSQSRSACGERSPIVQCIGGWVRPTRAHLDPVEKRKISCPYQESNPGRPTCSPSLNRLRYSSSEGNCSCLYTMPSKCFNWANGLLHINLKVLVRTMPRPLRGYRIFRNAT
jgi:hypothetical protein